ncbi:MAG: hypothetical protein R3B13_20870 [Polyangiaceae bacterium]
MIARTSLLGVLAATLAAGLLAPAPVRAQKATADATQCSVRGLAQLPIDLPIYDKSEAGTPIARFTGGESALAASDFFAGGGKRVQVQTGTGKGSFRIAGWAEAAKIPVFTSRRISVVPGHLYIAPYQSVEVQSGSSNRLKLKKRVFSSIQQTFSAWTDCSGLTFDSKSPPAYAPSGHARGYVLKRDSVELYDDYQAERSLVTVLNKSADSEGVLLWSEEQKGGWVHVEYHGDVIIDAWARSRDLKALPRGETMDVQRGAVTKRSAPKLKLAEKPTLVTTTKEVPIRTGARDDAPVIGRIEADTETYVLDTIAGWSSVLPKALNVAPYGDGQFWVKSSDLTSK